jgi:hypothetical protein
MMNYWESYGNIKEKKGGGVKIWLIWNLSKGITFKEFKACINMFFFFSILQCCY